MKRSAELYLDQWKKRNNRKPLIIRGARQVGKTYLVRSFAKKFENLIEINFERYPELAELFSSNEPAEIIGLLGLHFGTQIKEGSTLLFLDEIQAKPEILSTLRYFYEDMANLHVIAVGSLLEFALEQPAFSMPVGRIEYLFLGPMQFEEYLAATGNDALVQFLNEFILNNKIPEVIHHQFIKHLRTFMVTGGMPEVVKRFCQTDSWQECEIVKNSIVSTFQNDFNKYGKRMDSDVLYDLFRKIPVQVGQKFKYVNINRYQRAAVTGKALELLCHAKVVNKIHHSSGNGIPLGAEINHRKFKTIFLDVGLMATICGVNFLDLTKAEDILLVNRGAMCEQFIGQHLLYAGKFYQEPELFYWAREQKSSSAEVDYLVASQSLVIPVEVKAGSGSSLKSLHAFVKMKNRKLGIRFNSDVPSILDTATSLANMDSIPFRLLSLPLYMVGQTKRLLDEAVRL